MFLISAQQLSKDELVSLVKAVSDDVRWKIHLHGDSRGLLPSPEATVVASVIGGSAAVAAAIINGLFNRWNARLGAMQSAKSRKPRIVVVLAKRTLQLSPPEHLVDESDV